MAVIRSTFTLVIAHLCKRNGELAIHTPSFCFLSLYTNIRFSMILAFQFMIITIVQSEDSLFVKLNNDTWEV